MTDELLTKIMRSVHVEIRLPMKIRISKWIREREQDSHVMEVEIGADLAKLQKEVTSIARRWKDGFEVGTCYRVERLE